MDSERAAFQQLGQELSSKHSEGLSTQLAVFKSALISFAHEHGQEIRENGEFRDKFSQICQLVRVDPMELVISAHSSSSKKEGPGRKKKRDEEEEFYIALTVRVVEICQQTRDLNGGLILIKELVSILGENESVGTQIGEEDLRRGLATMDVLGKGYEFLDISGKTWLKCSSATSGDLSISNDQKSIFEVCEFTGGYATTRLLRDNLGWDQVRCKAVIDQLIMDGFLWVDSQARETQYWVPSWISE